MKSTFRILIGLALLAGGVALTVLLVATKPEAERKVTERAAPVVEVMPVKFETLTLSLPSQGMIDARRRTRLSAEVSGRVIEVSPKFDAGQAFDEGEVLIKIDPSDYEAALAGAESNLADARLGLATEEARADQALKDWKALGRSGEPSELTLRKPHVESAKAMILAAEQSVEKAKRDLQRTEVTAPFAGQLSKTEVELGAYVGPGTPVAEIFTTAPWEIRLPLSIDDWAFLNRDGSDKVTGIVGLTARSGNSVEEWKGAVLRTEGEVERESRSIYLVAEVPGESAGPLLQPGLFVQAKIEGQQLKNVARIPFKAFVGLDEVSVVDDKNTIQTRKVEIVRRAGDEVIVSGGLKQGERLCLTQLSDMVEGMTVIPQVVDTAAVLTGEPGVETTKP